MKPTGGGGIGMIGTIGTTIPLPVVVAGSRAVSIGKAVGSGRGPEI